MKLGTAILAGAAGSLAMDLVQDGFSAIFERNRAPDDRDEETEAIVAVVDRLADFFSVERSGRSPGVVGRCLHYAFGSGFALAYAAARIRRPEVSVGRGLPFGLALWLLSDVILIPAAHLGRASWRYSPAERANAVLSHLCYAATVEAVLQAVE